MTLKIRIKQKKSSFFFLENKYKMKILKSSIKKKLIFRNLSLKISTLKIRIILFFTKYFFFVLFEKIVKMNFIPENKVIENKYKKGFRVPENKDKNLKLIFFSLIVFKRKYAFTNLYLFSRFLFFNFHFLILSIFSKKIILDFRGSHF